LSLLYHVTIGGQAIEVEVSAKGVSASGRARSAGLGPLTGSGVRSLLLDGASHRLLARRAEPGVWELQLGGRTIAVEVVDERTRRVRAMAGGETKPSGPKPLKAPMPGLVVKVEVAAGDTVVRGQGLVIVEAMKMENELRADVPGVVKAVHVQAGQTIDKGQVLVEFEVLGGGAER
jgi:biotin carboxyl carrier protein